FTQFTAMMISADSKYDRHINKMTGGDFTADEQAGYILFRQKCSSCHTEPLFTDGSYRNNGLDEISADAGRDSLTSNRSDLGKFRVPSLRNAEITSPYMHDGRFSSLKQVLQHYNSWIHQHVNLDPLLKSGIPLNTIQQAQLTTFLKTLTDVSFINDRRFNNH
ncbi:MAG TPA: cytochrome-c peroxidase, partial [Pedobacter sp.]